MASTEMDELASILYNGNTLPVDRDGVIIFEDIELPVDDDGVILLGEVVTQDLVQFQSLHPVKIGGKYGFANENNQIVIPAEYSRVKPFVNNRAKVCKNGRYGFIDRSGTVVIPIIYEKADDFYEQKTSVVVNGSTYTIDLDGNRV